ncbi:MULTISPECIES: Cof-type HAD-IIB family hydrolase [Thermoactinomyces]|uniref:Cof-type HAD-IIB family hydrolase n=1 Tax=Thermoactinomyces daqus TaxID=1329516 RepID=A0A7W1X9U2_9BACL|nr:Cof-type HAD-IIB family hydrolase [Thermoactinomyces daqus]MBA4542777.1 Cof-type HAD-IIB family hydrolase [Thermoactinomyces daqus]MBH8598550.1 Cof-type HAD-IIB family hydrolase [Thermoactinomyces sp. CICC 10523]MBH8604606.1 Cof-type HAD-IIB family hydrolase [Thermoactinomyces sp. CICC 10522]MBH8606935.1 Cof-type HAD-IIB family hydrolase [Thermoactinomyces sp. CICC 10521]
MVKLVVSDLDGTLLNEEGKVSEENKRALRLAEEHGVQVMIATGRPYRSAMEVVEEAGLKCPLIFLNGACIQTRDGERIQSIPLGREQAEMLHQRFEEIGIYHQAYTDQGLYASRRGFDLLKVELDRVKSANPEVDPDVLKSATIDRLKHYCVSGVHVEDALQNPDASIYKILAFSMEPDKLEQARKKAEELSGVIVTASAENNIEVNHPEAQKGKAVALYAEKLGIPLEQVMVIGDNRNDLSMMKIAGYSVAMGNADDEVKRVCKYVTKSNSEHGVAYAIEKWALAKA